MTISFGNDGEKKVNINPVKWARNKMNRYYQNPNELVIDSAVIVGGSLVLERVGYFINSITRASKARQK